MILTVTLNAAVDKRYVVKRFASGEVNRVRKCVYTPGGKGLNVARVAAIAGEKVVAAGFVGGHAGRYIEEALQPLGIEHAFYHLEAESRSCINIWDEAAGTQTEFLEPGFTVSPEEFCGFRKQFQELAEQADIISISGSVPGGLEENVYQELVSIGREAGKKVILDTSGTLLEQGIKACPTMIKPNLDEIRMLTGKRCQQLEDIVDAAEKIHEQGVEIVVISLGSKGSLMVCADGVFEAQVPKIETVNTVGCGDSMIAGFASGLREGLAFDEMLRKASAISAAAALREETGFFVKEDMERILPMVRIRRL